MDLIAHLHQVASLALGPLFTIAILALVAEKRVERGYMNRPWWPSQAAGWRAQALLGCAFLGLVAGDVIMKNLLDAALHTALLYVTGRDLHRAVLATMNPVERDRARR